jgi:hypothetical protein
MAGGTKCYRVTVLGGHLQREVVYHSPKHADSAAAAVLKLRAGEAAIVRFFEIGAVEQEYAAGLLQS